MGKRIKFMAIYLTAFYLPYFLCLSAKFDILHISLSRIGWRYDGVLFLWIYGALTIPFLLFELFTYARYSADVRPQIKIAACMGCALLCGGILIPYRQGDANVLLMLHRIACNAGALILLFLIAYLLFKYCEANRKKKNLCIALNIFYCIFLGAFIQSYFTLGTTAVFEVATSYVNLIILFLLNLLCYRTKKQNAAGK